MSTVCLKIKQTAVCDGKGNISMLNYISVLETLDRYGNEALWNSALFFSRLINDVCFFRSTFILYISDVDGYI